MPPKCHIITWANSPKMKIHFFWKGEEEAFKGMLLFLCPRGSWFLLNTPSIARASKGSKYGRKGHWGGALFFRDEAWSAGTDKGKLNRFTLLPSMVRAAKMGLDGTCADGWPEGRARTAWVGQDGQTGRLRLCKIAVSSRGRVNKRGRKKGLLAKNRTSEFYNKSRKFF